MYSRNSYGVVFSIHQVMGSTGSDTAAAGSFFTKRQRWIISRQGVEEVEVMCSVCVVK